MNDFTKEELEELKRCLKYMISGDVTPYGSITLSLNKKIQSIIDNYDKPCSHPKLRRLSLLDNHDYDVCAYCNFIRMIR